MSAAAERLGGRWANERRWRLYTALAGVCLDLNIEKRDRIRRYKTQIEGED